MIKSPKCLFSHKIHELFEEIIFLQHHSYLLACNSFQWIHKWTQGSRMYTHYFIWYISDDCDRSLPTRELQETVWNVAATQCQKILRVQEISSRIYYQHLQDDCSVWLRCSRQSGYTTPILSYSYWNQEQIMILSFFHALSNCFFRQGTTDITKYALGRLRPHFLTVCEADYSSFNCTDSKVSWDVATQDRSHFENQKYIKRSNRILTWDVFWQLLWVHSTEFIYFLWSTM